MGQLGAGEGIYCHDCCTEGGQGWVNPVAMVWLMGEESRGGKAKGSKPSWVSERGGGGYTCRQMWED